MKIKNYLLSTILLLICFVSGKVFAQSEYPLSGQVSDVNGEGLPGVVVKVEKKNISSVTDLKGNYTIQVTRGDLVSFSYVGLAQEEVRITNQTNLSVVLLSQEIDNLDDVVVIGYGTQKKSHLTGAISKVVNKDLDQLPVPRADDALVGKISGVNIQATSGQVGDDPTIRVRGVGSITAGAGPLLVIDGMAVDADFFGSIDMNDVESIEVLKDAASAAIFGSRGANGVIMITTKSGDTGGKMKLSYNGYVGFHSVPRNPNYNTSLADLVAREQAETGTLSDRTRYKQRIGIDHNWQDDIFDGGVVHSHSVGLRGGNKQTRFSSALTYLGDQGAILTDDFQKYNIKLKVDTRIREKLTFGLSGNFTYTNRRRFDGSAHDILRQTPWLPIYHDENTIQYVDRNVYPNVQVGDYAIQRHFDNYDLDGDGGEVDISNTSNTNPAAKVLERERRDFKTKLFGRMYIQYEFTDYLNFQSALSATYQNTIRTRWQGGKANRNGNSAIQSDYSNNNRARLTWDNFLNFDKTFGAKHEISALLGTSVEIRDELHENITGTGYDFDYVETINAATTISAGSSYARQRRLLSYIGRVNYAYDDKYLLSVSYRLDGSSVFGEDKKFGDFPAVSVGWRLAKEDFMKGVSWISELKLRFSYGITGNDAISTGDPLTDYYAYVSLLGVRSAVVGGNVVGAYNPQNIPNPGLQWERSVEINPGIDFAFFNGRVSGSFEYYNRSSEDLILNLATSGPVGFNNALVNMGKVENEGIEFEVRVVNISKKKFRWATTFVGSRNKNTLISFGNSNGLISNVDTKRAAEWINLVGNPIASFYGFVVDREIPKEFIKNPYHPVGAEAQDVYVKDLNGDGIIDDDDKTILGDPYPEFVWSVNNEFKIGAFDFSFMFQGSHGAEVRNMGDQYLYNHFNSSQDFDPATTPDQGFIQQKIFTDAIIQNASYVSLRNIRLGYTVPKSFLSKLQISTLQVYVSARNLLYITADDYTGFNPEAITTTSPITYGYQRAGEPVYRTISFGLKMEF